MTTTQPSSTIRWVIFIAIALLALAVRLPQLGQRPMHTDESVNAYITGELLAGKAYQYDPQDRHGPILYLFAEPVVRLCGATDLAGLTETQLRLTTVIMGSVMVLMFVGGVKMFGFIPCLIAALLFAVGPLPVYYSRYFIHETLFVAATFGLILAGWNAVKNNSIPAAILAGLCAAAMLACKETAVIHFFALGATCIAWLWDERRRLRLREQQPEDRPAFGERPTHAIPLRIPALALGVFILATVLLFTGFGRNWTGLADLFQAIPNFTARAGGQGHEKPFGYYFSILDPMFLFFIIAAAGVYCVICDVVAGNRRVGLWLTIYALLIFLIYSTIPYKTPWLALNFWLPLALLCGFGVEGIWLQLKNPAGRWVAVIAVAMLVLVTGQETRTLAFNKPADEKNPLAYAHTMEGVLDLPVRIEEICRQRNLNQPRIAVVAEDPWPLPWYLRQFSNTGYWSPGQEVGSADLFITSTDISDELALRLEHYRPEYFGVRPNVLLILWKPSETDLVE